MTRRDSWLGGSIVIGVVAVLAVLDTGPNVPIVAALALLACGALWSLRRLLSDAAPPAPAIEQPDPPEALPDLRLTSLRQALAAGGADDRLADRIHRQLVDVVDDELHATYGIDRDADPGAARSVLGDDLFRFVDDRDGARDMGVRELTTIVGRIESLGSDV